MKSVTVHACLLFFAIMRKILANILVIALQILRVIGIVENSISVHPYFKNLNVLSGVTYNISLLPTLINLLSKIQKSLT